jgi:Spy/CpxP family protein refolding chaperone
MMGLAAAGAPAVVGKGHAGWWAKGPLGRMITGNIGRLMVLRSELNVTDQQREKIKAVVVAHKSEILAEAKAIVQKRRALRHAVLTERPDEAAIRKGADELGHEIGNAAVLAAKIKDQVAPLLSGEQKELVKKCIADCEKSVDRFFEEAARPR